MNVATLQVKDNAIVPRLYIAMELSNKSWKVVFSDGVKRRRVTIEARHREQLREAIAKAKEKFRVFGNYRGVPQYIVVIKLRSSQGAPP